MLEQLRAAIKEDNVIQLNSLLAQLKLQLDNVQIKAHGHPSIYYDFFSTLIKDTEQQQNHQALSTLMQFMLLNHVTLNVNIDNFLKKHPLFIKNPDFKNTIFEGVFKNIIHDMDETALIKFFCFSGFNAHFFCKFASVANYHQLLAKVRTFGPEKAAFLKRIPEKAAFLKRLLEYTVKYGDVQHLDLIVKEVAPENLIAVMIPEGYSASNYLAVLLNKGHIAIVKKYLATALSLKAENEIFYESFVEACLRAAAWEVSVELLNYMVDSVGLQFLYRIIEENKRYLAKEECIKDPRRLVDGSKSFLMFYNELLKIIGLGNQSLFFSCLAHLFAESLSVSNFRDDWMANTFIMAYEDILPEVLQASEAGKIADPSAIYLLAQNKNIKALRLCIDALLKYAKTPQQINTILSKLFLEAAANSAVSCMELLVKDADQSRLTQYFSIENNQGLTAFFSLSKKPELCQHYMARARELFAVPSSQYSHILQDVLKGSIEHRQYAFFDELITLAAEQELVASPALIGQILNLAIKTAANPLLKKKNMHLLPYLFQLLGLYREKNSDLHFEHFKSAIAALGYYEDGDPLLATILEAAKRTDDIKAGAYASIVVELFKDAVLNDKQKSVALFLQDVSGDSLVVLLTEANSLYQKSYLFSDLMKVLLEKTFFDAAQRLKAHHSEQSQALALLLLLRAIKQGSLEAVSKLLPLVDRLKFAEHLFQNRSESFFYYRNEILSNMAKDFDLILRIYQFLQPLHSSQPILYYSFVEQLFNKSIDDKNIPVLLYILENTQLDVLAKLILFKKQYQERNLTALLKLNDTAITQALVKVSENIKKTKPEDYAFFEQELFIFSAQTGNLVLFNSLTEAANAEELIRKLTLKFDYNTTIIDTAGQHKQTDMLNRLFELVENFQTSHRYVYLAVAHNLIINAALCTDLKLMDLILKSCAEQELMQLFFVPRFRGSDSYITKMIKATQINAIEIILKALAPLAKTQPAYYLDILRLMLYEAAKFSDLKIISRILDAAGKENWLSLFKIDTTVFYNGAHECIFSRAMLNKDDVIFKYLFSCVAQIKERDPELYSMGYLFKCAQDLKKFTVNDLALFIDKHSSSELINMCEGWNIRGCETLISAIRFNKNFEVQGFLFNWLKNHEKNNQARYLKILAIGFKVALACTSDRYNNSQAETTKYFLECILEEVGAHRLQDFLNITLNEGFNGRVLLRDSISGYDSLLPSVIVQELNKSPGREADRISTSVQKEFFAALSQPSHTIVNMLKLASEDHLVEYFSSDKLSGPYKTTIWNCVFSNSDGEVFEAVFSSCQRLKLLKPALFVSSMSQAFADACEVAPLATVQRIYAELPLKKQILALDQATSNCHQILAAGLKNKNKTIFPYLISLLEPVKKSQPNIYIQIIKKNLQDCMGELSDLTIILNTIPISLLTQVLLSDQQHNASIFHHYNISQQGFELILSHLETQLNNPEHYPDYIKSLAFAYHATLNATLYKSEMNILNVRILNKVTDSALLSLLTTYCGYGLIIDSIIDNESLWALNHIITALPSLRLIQPTAYLDFMAKLLPGLLNKKGLYEIAQKLFEALTEAELLKVLNFNGRHGQNLIEASLWGDDSGLVCKLLSVQVRRIRSFDSQSYQQLNVSMLLSLIASRQESAVQALLEYLGAEEFSQLLAVSYQGENAFSSLIPNNLFMEDDKFVPVKLAYIILQAAKLLKCSSPIAYQNAVRDALILSAERGLEKSVKLFLTLLPEQQWAEFSLLENKAGMNLITAAISSGDRAVVEFVLGIFSVEDLKKVLAHRDSAGRNLILVAAAYGFFELIPWLRSQGLDILATDLFKQSIFDYAVDLGNLAAISVFREFSLTASLIDKAGYKGRTPLMTAIKVGRLKTAAVLIQLGADLKLTDQQNYSALTWAVSSRQLTVIHNLIQAGAKVEPKSLEVARLIDDADILAALKIGVSYVRVQQSVNQLQPSLLRPSLPHAAVKLSRNYLTLFPATKLKNKTYSTTADLQTQSEALLSLPGYELTAMKEKYKDLSRYLAIPDVLYRERVVQCVDDPKNLKITLYTGFTQQVLLLRLVMQAMYKLEAEQSGDIGIIQRNMLNEYWPSRAPDIDKYKHQHQSEFISHPRSDISHWDWFNASLFGNATNDGSSSIFYFLNNYNARTQDLKGHLEGLFKALGLSPELLKIKAFINTFLDYAEKLKTPVGGLQVVELPIAVVDQVCRFDGEINTLYPKVSEYILKARKTPKAMPDFPWVEIVMMPDFLFNHTNGIQSRVYHSMARLHPKTFYEFQAWMKKGLKELLIHQPSAEVDNKNSEQTRVLPRLKASL